MSFYKSCFRLNHITTLLDIPEACYKTEGALTFLCMECCGHTNCLRIPMDKEESNYHGTVKK